MVDEFRQGFFTMACNCHSAKKNAVKLLIFCRRQIQHIGGIVNHILSVAKVEKKNLCGSVMQSLKIIRCNKAGLIIHHTATG